MATTIDQFKGALLGGGARANLFRVTGSIGGVGDANLAFMIKAASLPASTIAAIEVPFRGRKLKIAGDKAYDSWKITAYNDTSFSIRKAFEKWMSDIDKHNSNAGLSKPASYMQDWTVEQLSKEGEAVLATYNFSGCWPVALGEIELNFDSKDAIEEFTIELAYQYWTGGGAGA